MNSRTVDDLIAFLRARLDEDEQIARYSEGSGPWTLGECVPADEPGGTEWEISSGGYVHTRVRGNMRANHIARHDPARVLREVEAKRRIIAECIPSRVGGSELELSDALGEVVLAFLALPYSGHPDYQEAWKP